MTSWVSRVQALAFTNGHLASWDRELDMLCLSRANCHVHPASAWPPHGLCHAPPCFWMWSRQGSIFAQPPRSCSGLCPAAPSPRPLHELPASTTRCAVRGATLLPHGSGLTLTSLSPHSRAPGALPSALTAPRAHAT